MTSCSRKFLMFFLTNKPSFNTRPDSTLVESGAAPLSYVELHSSTPLVNWDCGIDRGLYVLFWE